MMELFERLDEARIARGHSVVDAVKELGISHSLWYAWKNGDVAKPMKFYVDAIEKYIKNVEQEKTG